MRFKIVCLLALLSLYYTAGAQRRIINMPEHDDKLYYFGITFGANFSQYRITYTQSFVNSDTFKSIQPKWSPGFNLGLMANLRINKFIDLRFIPSLSFADKRLTMTMSPNDSTSSRSIESIYLHLPLQVKFKSDRIRNFRFYGMLGGKFDYDLAANARSRRSDEWMKVKPVDLGYEIGVGFEFYYPNFIFSPEIKLSQGLGNQIYHDKNIPLTNAIDELHTRMIVISIHLEG
ncbi:MAG: PorT family protein [Bacteroidetes bacterium]|nr:PorT family protein [Bacteroidota bacterium]MBS1739307.1 PorT family protein [Bacteroidota bacterium]MBS1775607.1 PorT family protein [Bacteroidota bacterium]